MPIAGVIILTDPQKTNSVMEQMKTFEAVSTYGIHKVNHIVAVFEAEEPKGLELLSKNLNENIPGILGIYPAYVNFEDEMDG